MIRPGIRKLLAHIARSPRAREREVDEEIRLHFELRAEQLMRRGLSSEEARRVAAQRFGPFDESRNELLHVASARERHMNWNERIDSVRQDVTFALRRLRRAPGFAITVVVTLALGIGANATMFGVVDRLLLQPPAGVMDPARVVTASVEVGLAVKHVQRRLSFPIYRDIRNASAAFDDVGAYDNTSLAVGTGLTLQMIPAVKATAGYFRALRVKPFAGRFFTDDESDREPGAHVIVLGYSYWGQHFGHDLSVIGRTVPVSGESYTVIGVAPPGFVGLDLGDVSAWIPFTAGRVPAFAHWQENRQWYTLNVIGRMHPGVGLAAAEAAGTASLRAGEITGGMPASEVRQRNERLLLTSALPRDARGAKPEGRVAVLVAAVSLLVLIIACANVANLQLARSMNRRREVAIRVALGVSRGRLLRQLALDGLILALIGGAGALVIIAWSSSFIRGELLSGASAQMAVVNWRILLYTAACAVLTGLITGLMPARESMRTELSDTLRAGGRGSVGGASRARFVLIALQAALTLVLLVGMVLFVFSLRRIESVPLGMDACHVLQVRINTEGVNYPPEQLARDYERLAQIADRSPEVTSSALSTAIPFGSSTSIDLSLPGRDSVPQTRDGGPYYYSVGPAFFRTLGAHMTLGKSFTNADHAGSPAIAVVNETAARLWWPNESPIGKCIRIGGDSMPCSDVVGVVGDVHRRAIVEEPVTVVYTPMGQGPSWATPLVLIVRTRRPAADAATAVTAQLRSGASTVPVTARPLTDAIDPQLHSWKLGATMFGLFAALAIVLAAVGLYGVMAYDVSARRSEIGVRMALGARGADIRWLVVLRGVRVVAIGGVVGALIALGAAPRVSALLFRTSPYEPWAFGIALTMLAVVSVSATVLPAWRAAGVDPNESLRSS